MQQRTTRRAYILALVLPLLFSGVGPSLLTVGLSMAPVEASHADRRERRRDLRRAAVAGAIIAHGHHRRHERRERYDRYDERRERRERRENRRDAARAIIGIGAAAAIIHHATNR